MKKVLILAYYFPPLGMGGTQRSAKFVKYLPEFGYRPFVITVKDVAYYAKDPTLLEDTKSAKIYRTGSLDPQRLFYLLSSQKSHFEASRQVASSRKRQVFTKMLSWLFVPDTKIFWLPFALFKSLQVIERENIKCIFTTSPPHSVHLLGLLLKRIKKVKWVADFRDGWAGGNFQYEPTRIHKWLNRSGEKRVLKNADRITAVSSLLKTKLITSSMENSTKFFTITNGFDLEDVSKVVRKQSREKKFVIIYCGALSAISPVNSFLRALARLFQTRPAMKKHFLLKFVGVDLDGSSRKTVFELSLEEVTQFTGYLTHLEALENILNADLLLYPVAQSASVDFIPGKTFEYLVSARPVLAIGPEIAGVKILRKFASVKRVAHENLSAIEHAIYDCYAKKQEGFNLQIKKDGLQKFERKYLTRQLAQILDHC